ncbi:MAG TPA: hypothetical protein DIV86_03645 [Alphaproteobacteria bacterium]|nr:hypothetical protein [Alphaproteobacteria bacterium]
MYLNVQKIANQNKLSETGFINIKSRFGELEIDMSKAIFFPKGIYGFPENLHFALVNFPNPQLQAFKILQCLNDHSISFPVLVAGYNNQFIHEKDMRECSEIVEVSHSDMAVMFIANSEKGGAGEHAVSINTKAPIIIDVNLQMAVQYIFTNNKYTIRHML